VATGAARLPAPPSANGHEDRRRVSVLFIDVVSFTRFVERSDPEQVRRMQSAFFATVRQVIGRYNGLVEKYIGDAVMALFGAPVATETAVLGCVSAALELQRTLRRQGEGDELSFGFRIGVATGEALVDTAAARDGGQAIAAGDVINTASRLQSAAPPGGVLVDGPTHAATADDFRYERREPVTLRGHTTPTELWVPVTQVRRRITARDQGTPLVNRVHELGLLTGALNRMVTDREPQLVTLFGRAGIGKSRLVTELFRYAESRSPGIRWCTGHCPPFGENVTYAAFADIVKTEAGILDSDDAATARVRLREAVSRLVPPAEADRLTNALGPLVGLPGQQLLAEDTESAWRRFVVALASDRPTVLVIEDLHWADQTMVSFVERLGAVVRDVPLLVLCTSRPELLEREPAWAAAIAGSQTISLSPMNDAHIADMYAALFGQATFPPDMLDKLIELAGGNPLYAHEYFRMLLEQGGLTGEAHGPATAHPIPDNVHAVIANRLDLLDPDDRLVLQAASVLGVVFWPDAVASTLRLPAGAVERTLRRMEQRDLVREQESTREGQTEYRFSHVLIRDVCYQRLPRTERVAQHARIADWLEAVADTTGNRAEDLAEVVANHRYSAHEVARTLQLDTTPYAPPARRALHRAARRAYRLHALDVAATHVTRALRLFGPELGDDAADENERHELELLDAELAFLRDSDGFLSGGGLDRLDRLTSVLDRTGNLESSARAWTLRGHVAWMTADRHLAMQNLTRAIDRFAALPDSEAKADAHAELARLRLTSDEHLSAIEAAGVAAEIAGRLGLIEVRATAMITIGMSRYLLGEVEGMAILEEALDTCRRLKLPSTRRVTRNLAVCLQEEGELDRAIALLAESEGTSVGDGHSVIPNYSAAAHQAYLAGDWNGTLVANDALRDSPSGAWDLQSRLQSVWLRALRGETTDEDAAEVDEVVHAGRESGFPRLTWTTLGQGALCRALLGAPDDCVTLLTDLAANWLPLGSLPSGEWTAAAGHAAALLGGTAATTLSGMLDRSPRDTPWVRAARASAAGALAADDGDHSTAAERHAEAAELYRRIGTRSDEILSLAVAVREYRLAAAADRAEQHLREVKAFAAANGADRILTL
jgi:class 3 adenylate cyclase